jgi:hypothetical protein
MVLGDVPRAERCACRDSGASKATGRPAASKHTTPAEPAGALAKFASWLRK